MITPEGLTSDNYDITFVDGELTINQVALTVTADDQSKDYDGEVFPTDDYTVTYDGFVTGEDETDLGGTLDFSGTAITAVDAGDYVITPEGLTSDNYEISYVNGALTISKEELTVDGSFTAADKEYDGTTDATIVDNSLTLDGVVSGEESDVSLDPVAAFASADVGTHEVSLTSATDISGAASANYTLSLDGAPTTTAEILDTLVPVTATQTSRGFFSPSALYDKPMVVSNTLDFGASTLKELTWQPTLPTGWSLVDAGGDASPTVAAGEITFTGTELEELTEPVSFWYSVEVPGNQDVIQTVDATVSYRADDMSSAADTNLTELTAYRYHSADYLEPYRDIKYTEAGRVLAIWRAGGYFATNTKDDAGYAWGTGESVDDHVHSADYDETTGEIDSEEVNRVLAYWRQGYSVDETETSDDGYVVGTEGVGPMSIMGLSIVPQISASLSVNESGYNPGQRLDVTAEVAYEGTTLAGLVWKPELPKGWTIESVSGEGSPEEGPDGGIVWTATTLPASPVKLDMVVSVPEWEYRDVDISGEASVLVPGASSTLTPQATAQGLSFKDSDGDGVADVWNGDEAAQIKGTFEEVVISSIERTDEGVKVSWNAMPLRLYKVERAMSLTEGYHEVGAVRTDDADGPVEIEFTDDSEEASGAFYRIKVLMD